MIKVVNSAIIRIFLSYRNNSYSYSADLVQPIFRLDRWFQFGQGRAMSEVAKAQFSYAQQETILRVTETYFNLLKAKKDLEVAKSEEAAIKKQRDRSKRLFEEGVTSVTEFQEAQAFYDLARVSTIAGEGQLEFSREALIAIIGEAPELKDLNKDFPISSPDPKSQEEWVGLALSNNYLLKAAQMSTKAAYRNARSKLSNHLPDVDLVGNITRNTNRTISGFSGSGFSFDETEIENTRYSLQFSWPLMAGGLVSSERREAYALLEKAKQEEMDNANSMNKATSSASGGGDLLSDLANKLAMRRKGISGSQNQEATLSGNNCDSTNVSKLRLVRPWENGKPRKKSDDDSIEDDPETEETQETQEEIQEYVPLKKRRMIMYELDSKYSGVNFQNNSCH